MCQNKIKRSKPTLSLELQDKSLSKPSCFQPEVLLQQENTTRRQCDCLVHYPCQGLGHGSNKLRPDNILKNGQELIIHNPIRYLIGLSFGHKLD